MGFDIRKITMILLSAMVCLCAPAACSAEASQADSASEHEAIRKWAVMEQIPASILVDWKKYDFVTYDEMTREEKDLFLTIPKADVAENGFLISPKGYEANEAPYYLVICEYPGLPEEIEENVFGNDPGSDYRYFDFQDAPDPIMNAVYQEMTQGGEFSSEEKYIEAQEAKYIAHTYDQEGIKTECLTTCIDGHTITLYAMTQDAGFRNTAQDALYDLASVTVRNDRSKTLAVTIRNTEVAGKPTKFYTWGSIGTIYINEDSYFVLQSGDDMKDSDALRYLDITADEAKEFMGDAQMMVIPQGYLFKDAPLELLVYGYDLKVDSDSFLREGKENKDFLRKLILDSFEEKIDEYYIGDYKDSSGRIYMVFEEFEEIDEKETGILYYMTVCSGDLIILSCRYDRGEKEDCREAAVEMLRSFTAGFHDKRDEYYLPDIAFDAFGFTNASDGSDVIPMVLGKTYTIADHVLTESYVSDGTENSRHYHSYHYALAGENTKASEAMKRLGMNSDNALFLGEEGIYKEILGIPSLGRYDGTVDYLTAWYKDSTGVWNHCDIVQAASLFAGYKTLTDCEEVFVVDLGAGNDDVTEYIKVTWASYEDTLAQFFPNNESPEEVSELHAGDKATWKGGVRKSYDLLDDCLTVKLDQRIFDAFLTDNTDNQDVLKHQNLSDQKDLDAYAKMLGYEFFAVFTNRGYPENEIDFIVETPDMVFEGVDDIRNYEDINILAEELVSGYGQDTYTLYDTETASYIVFENEDKVSYFTIQDSRPVCLSLRVKYTEIKEEHRELMRQIIDDAVWTEDSSRQVETDGNPVIETTLLEGEEIQNILHDLSGYVFDYENGITSDGNIKSFCRSPEKAPEGARTRLLSEEGEPEVAAWYDDGTIYWYSDAEKIYALDMKGMFDLCGGLEKVDLSGIDTSAVTNMSCMFLGCESLTELDLSGLDTSSVTDMSHMFASCRNLKDLNLSSFDTSNVMNIEYMFFGCSSLTEIDLSSFDTSNVMNMEYMFSGCSSLTELDLSSFDTKEVLTFEAMFDNCHKLERLDLSNFSTRKSEDDFAMFHGCESLTWGRTDDARLQAKLYHVMVLGYDGIGVG